MNSMECCGPTITHFYKQMSISIMELNQKKLTQVYTGDAGKAIPMPASLTQLHSEWPKLLGVLAILSAIGLNAVKTGMTPTPWEYRP